MKLGDRVTHTGDDWSLGRVKAVEPAQVAGVEVGRALVEFAGGSSVRWFALAGLTVWRPAQDRTCHRCGADPAVRDD